MSENPRVKFAFNLNPPNSASTSPISSLACDQECRLLAVGGRDILKLVEVNFKDEKFVLKRNLRQTRVDIPRQNTVYLEWNPTNNNLLAAAALGGSISIWDVNQGVSTKLNKVLVSHNQAINKLNWHPTEPKYLVSASHDCTVKLWDLDDSAEPQATIKLNSSVRDVKFVPSHPHHIVAALESGGIEVFDNRKDSQSLFSNPNAHRLAILAMDFNPFNSKLFATGSIDKLVKIWDIDNIENEVYKIKYLSGVGFVKWKPDDETKMCVSSYSGDNSLSMWNTEQIHYPMGILKGHKDVVTACVYETALNYLITGSKDGYIICHPAEGAYKPMDYCNKYGLALDLDSTFAFTNNNKKMKTQSKNYRNISLVSRLNRFFGSKFTTLKDEIKYYSETYKKGGEDVQEISEYNSKVAFDKKFVSKIWKDIPTALKEMSADRDTSSINFGQFLKVNSALYDQDVTPMLSSEKTPKSYLTNNDLNHLIAYYEKHPEQFKSDFNEKLIAVKDGKIYIKPQYMRDVLKMIEETSKTLSRNESRQQDIKKLEKLTYDSIIKTVQELANVGELQSAYHLYFVLHERISFPESLVRLWALAYIELLRTYQFYQDSNEIIRSCPLQIISDGNKKSTTFYSRCGKCKKTSEFDDQYICSNCKNFISMCAICKLPVKGLMLWCQVCGHGGHYREVYSWFQNHSECPSGCGHKCFFIKSKSSSIK